MFILRGGKWDSFEIEGRIQDEKQEITCPLFPKRGDHDKNSEWGRDGGIEPKIVTGCRIEKAYVEPSLYNFRCNDSYSLKKNYTRKTTYKCSYC